MKEKRIKTFSGLIASALLIVSICSLPMTAEAMIVTSARTSKLSAHSQVKTDSVTVRVPTGGTVIKSVPTVLREKTLSGSQLKSTAGNTVVWKTGSSSAVPDISGGKNAAAPISSRVTVNTSKGITASALSVKTGGQPTKSNSSGDSLCLVVLGLKLNPNGSMQQELIDRLETLKIAAQKNPRAIIVCTGGHSGENNRSVSEASQMAKWLRENGIDPDRILVEPRAMSTQDNAVYTLDLLKRYHPEVSRIAVFTSDYHMDDGVRLFTSQAAKMGSGITIAAGNASRGQ